MPEPTMEEPAALREQFDRDGFLHLRGFAEREECDGMIARMQELVAAWDPAEQSVPVFVTGGKEQERAQGSSDYFLDSADRIHFFLEKDAAGPDGVLKPGIEKSRGLNKVGHGLHVVDDVFRTYSSSPKVQRLVGALGWQAPVLPQSMYIFKQPTIGGEVVSHQDSCFLHTTPRETCLGLWLSLHAATLSNGCLWVRPGSHREPVRRLFVRNPKHFEDGDKSAPKMVFEDNASSSDLAAWEWEGKMPEGSEPPSDGLRERGFRPVFCEPGDLVVIHGQVDHLSLPNTSKQQRETFQLHLVEGPTEGVEWSRRNWLQYPEGRRFPPLSGAEAATRKRKAEEEPC